MTDFVVRFNTCPPEFRSASLHLFLNIVSIYLLIRGLLNLLSLRSKNKEKFNYYQIMVEILFIRGRHPFCVDLETSKSNFSALKNIDKSLGLLEHH